MIVFKELHLGVLSFNPLKINYSLNDIHPDLNNNFAI